MCSSDLASPSTATPTARRVRPATRLPERKDFLRVQAAGRKQVAPGFILQTAPRPDAIVAGPARVGFTVSKKVGDSVRRNRARRRLRALARQVIGSLARNDWDYVLIGRKGTLERDFGKMAAELTNALRRLKALPEEAA